MGDSKHGRLPERDLLIGPTIETLLWRLFQKKAILFSSPEDKAGVKSKTIPSAEDLQQK